MTETMGKRPVEALRRLSSGYMMGLWSLDMYEEAGDGTPDLGVMPRAMLIDKEPLSGFATFANPEYADWCKIHGISIEDMDNVDYEAEARVLSEFLATAPPPTAFLFKKLEEAELFVGDFEHLMPLGKPARHHGNSIYYRFSVRVNP